MTALNLFETMRATFRILIISTYLLVSCASPPRAASDTFDQKTCFDQIVSLWGAANSYMFEQTYIEKDKRDWKTTVIDPKSLNEYLPRGVKLNCPSGQKLYPPFKVFEGPVCPNGHQFGSLTNPSYADFVKFIRLSAETGTITLVTNGAASPSIAERRLCARVVIRFYDQNPSETKRAIKKLLDDEDFLVRTYTVQSLEYVDQPFAIEFLRRALKDTEPVVRSTAASTCARVKSRALIRDLIENLAGSDPRVQEACASALQQITGQAFGKDTGKWRQWLKLQR